MTDCFTITKRAIEQRSKYYRNLVVAFVATIIFFVIISLYKDLIFFLFVLPCLVFFCGIFILFDHHAIKKWQVQILQIWCYDNINLKTLSKTLCAIQNFPPRTIQSMLNILPIELYDDNKTDNKIDKDLKLKEGIVATLTTINTYQNGQIITETTAYVIGLVMLVNAFVKLSWFYVLGLLLLFFIPLLYKHLYLAFFSGWRKHIRLLKKQGLIITSFVQIAERLNWQPINNHRKAKLLAAIVDDDNS